MRAHEASKRVLLVLDLGNRRHVFLQKSMDNRMWPGTLASRNALPNTASVQTVQVVAGQSRVLHSPQKVSLTFLRQKTSKRCYAGSVSLATQIPASFAEVPARDSLTHLHSGWRETA